MSPTDIPWTAEERTVILRFLDSELETARDSEQATKFEYESDPTNPSAKKRWQGAFWTMYHLNRIRKNFLEAR